MEQAASGAAELPRCRGVGGDHRQLRDVGQGRRVAAPAGLPGHARHPDAVEPALQHGGLASPPGGVHEDEGVGRSQQLGVAGEDVLLVTVPGALEAPLALQKMAESGQFDALIALGAVIRGETYHFELVSNESAAGITRVGLDFNIAIANGILTTDTDAQAHARTREKGRDCARAAVEMANLTSDLDGLQDHGQDEENE